MCNAVCAHACSRRCTGTSRSKRRMNRSSLAATLSAGDGSAVSHRSATAHWGVDGFQCELVEITHPFEHHLRLRDVVLASQLRSRARRHRVRRAIARHLTHPHADRPRRGCPPVARLSGARAVALARDTSPFVRVRDGLDVVARRGRAGAGVLRKVLDERVLRLEASDSHAEVVLAEALRGHGGAQPLFHELSPSATTRSRSTSSIPPRCSSSKCDGYGPHTQPEAFEEDRRRQNLLIDAGYMVRRYSAARVMRRCARRRGRDRGGPQSASNPAELSREAPSDLSADATENASGGVRGGGRQ